MVLSKRLRFDPTVLERLLDLLQRCRLQVEEDNSWPLAPGPRPPAKSPTPRNLTALNVLQQNIGGFCPVSVCAPED
jgi:hypothetical protein